MRSQAGLLRPVTLPLCIAVFLNVAIYYYYNSVMHPSGALDDGQHSMSDLNLTSLAPPGKQVSACPASVFFSHMDKSGGTWLDALATLHLDRRSSKPRGIVRLVGHCCLSQDGTVSAFKCNDKEHLNMHTLEESIIETVRHANEAYLARNQSVDSLFADWHPTGWGRRAASRLVAARKQLKGCPPRLVTLVREPVGHVLSFLAYTRSCSGINGLSIANSIASEHSLLEQTFDFVGVTDSLGLVLSGLFVERSLSGRALLPVFARSNVSDECELAFALARRNDNTIISSKAALEKALHDIQDRLPLRGADAERVADATIAFLDDLATHQGVQRHRALDHVACQALLKVNVSRAQAGDRNASVHFAEAVLSAAHELNASVSKVLRPQQAQAIWRRLYLIPNVPCSALLESWRVVHELLESRRTSVLDGAEQLLQRTPDADVVLLDYDASVECLFKRAGLKEAYAVLFEREGHRALCSHIFSRTTARERLVPSQAHQLGSVVDECLIGQLRPAALSKKRSTMHLVDRISGKRRSGCFASFGDGPEATLCGKYRSIPTIVSCETNFYAATLSHVERLNRTRFEFGLTDTCDQNARDPLGAPLEIWTNKPAASPNLH